MAKKEYKDEDGKIYTAKEKKPFYKKWRVWALVIVIIAAIYGSGSKDNKKEAEPSSETKVEESKSSEAKESVESKTSEAKEDKVPIEYQNALAKAKSYIKTGYFSKTGLYNQLTSEYGEKFPAEAAQYAMDNLDVDYNKEALEAAESYQKNMQMSNDAIYDQLTSEAGEGFTAEEAQYAIDNLEK